MFEQVRATAGIHMSTFKDKASKTATSDDDGDDFEGGSNWTPPPTFMATMRKS